MRRTEGLSLLHCVESPSGNASGARRVEQSQCLPSRLQTPDLRDREHLTAVVYTNVIQLYARGRRRYPAHYGFDTRIKEDVPPGKSNKECKHCQRQTGDSK